MDNVRSLDSVNPEKSVIEEAAGVLRRGGLVAFPTETVYGLGADALNDAACEKIFEAKGRQLDNPMIVHVNTFEQLEYVTDGIEPHIREKLEIVWPGPLTLVLRRGNIGRVPTAGLETVAVRMPAHRVPQELIKESGRPIAAPSANRSGSPSPVYAHEVLEDLGNKVDLILDGGASYFGVESTVIVYRGDDIVILRPGAFSPEDLKRIFNTKIRVTTEASGVPISPGMKYRHYAPEKDLILGRSDEKIIRACEKGDVLFIGSKELAAKVNTDSIVLGSRENLYEIARNLFSSFRKLDKSEYSSGIIEEFEGKGIGLAIMNRIVKATGGREL